MQTIKASVKPSAINGLGLFADEDIKKGTVVWKFNPLFDILFSPDDVKKMPQEQQKLIERYASLSSLSGKYVYSIDNSRFTNHSAVKNNLDVVFDPNEPELLGVANRDIKTGEELLVNYREFDVHDKNSSEKYLDS